MKNILYIVIPCYNEEEVLNETVTRLSIKMSSLMAEDKISLNSRILLVNDGSEDKTWQKINELFQSNELVTGITLAKNRGHQYALLAGLMVAKQYADMIISMDADLQDDINAIDYFISEYEKGSEIVYGVRSSRKKDSFFKKSTALMFYKFMKLLGVDMVYNHADYRLMSKRAVVELEKFGEVNLFLRGIIPLIGLKTSTVEYERNERFAGVSKYPLRKMLSFAFEGITSCSVKPLRMITSFGFTVAFISFIYLIYVIVGHFVGNTISGWTTQIVLICLFGGIQIFCIGAIGEYIGKIYKEVKHRPRFVIEEEKLK